MHFHRKLNVMMGRVSGDILHRVLKKKCKECLTPYAYFYFSLPSEIDLITLALASNSASANTRTTAGGSSMRACHQPEHGRSVCLACVVDFRTLTVAASRCLVAAKRVEARAMPRHVVVRMEGGK